MNIIVLGTLKMPLNQIDWMTLILFDWNNNSFDQIFYNNNINNMKKKYL